jgi:hypothetical protein
VVVLVVAISALAAACGGSDDPVDDVAPEQRLERAAAELRSADTFRFTLAGSGAAEALELALPGLGGNIQAGEAEIDAEGALDRPDRLTLTAQVDVGPFAVPATLTVVGGDLYVSAIGRRLAIEVPAGELRELDPTLLISALLGRVADPETTGSERIAGADTARIDGTLDGGALARDLRAIGLQDAADAVGDALRDARITVWVGIDDNRVYRLRLRVDEQAAETDVAGVGRLSLDLVAEFRDFDEPVEIEPPANAQRVSVDQLADLFGVLG